MSRAEKEEIHQPRATNGDHCTHARWGKLDEYSGDNRGHRPRVATALSTQSGRSRASVPSRAKKGAPHLTLRPSLPCMGCWCVQSHCDRTIAYSSLCAIPPTYPRRKEHIRRQKMRAGQKRKHKTLRTGGLPHGVKGKAREREMQDLLQGEDGDRRGQVVLLAEADQQQRACGRVQREVNICIGRGQPPLAGKASQQKKHRHSRA